MDHTTYATEDMIVVFSHPALGQFAANKKGLVSITFGRATDMAQQDVALGGSVMTSKIVAKNGTVVVVVQQTSKAAAWLSKWINYVENCSADQFTAMNVSASSKMMGKSHTGTGVCPQKMPDKGYGAQGAQETYTLLGNEIEESVA